MAEKPRAGLKTGRGNVLLLQQVCGGAIFICVIRIKMLTFASVQVPLKVSSEIIFTTLAFSVSQN